MRKVPPNLLALVGGLSLLALSCKREERTFRVPVPSADPVYSVELSTLHPGTTQPSTQPRTRPRAPVKNHYEENAYALSEGQRLFYAYNCSGCHAHGPGEAEGLVSPAVGGGAVMTAPSHRIRRGRTNEVLRALAMAGGFACVLLSGGYGPHNALDPAGPQSQRITKLWWLFFWVC